MESVVSLSAQNAGFTLIELMIVIVLVAIFITVGVPSFQNLVSDNRLSTQANSLISSLQLARSEALKLRTPVSVCRSTNGATCAGAGAWETGWLVFEDTNGNGDVDG
jgi:type IV fimbrial biogenesis protein FimT